MTLGPARWHEIAPSEYPWERQALAWLRAQLPDREPWHVWTNFEFIDDGGRVNEVDALVLSPAGLFLVEIKSRHEYTKPYLEDLCRATLAALKAYPGPYCIESFDPRVVGIIRHQAPGVLRGQLSDSYRSYRHDGTHPVPAYVLSHCFGNFLGRPDFIAWCPDKRNWAVRLADALGAMPVMWTALPEHNTKQLEAENDAVIFQWYEPVEKYK